MLRFDVRCHEWGDDSDYHWEYCNTLDAALKVMTDFYLKDSGNIYERLYVIEEKDDGTKSIPDYNRDTYKLFMQRRYKKKTEYDYGKKKTEWHLECRESTAQLSSFCR